MNRTFLLAAAGGGLLLAACADLPTPPERVAPDAAAPQTAPGQWLSGSFSNAAGSRSYKLYVPTGYASGTPAPLVVMLHGCTQDPEQFANGTRMTDVGEANGFLVVFPEQPSGANSSKCWNWFETAHQSRGGGEPSLIAGIVGEVKGQYSVDAGRVYVAGFSGGAAMAVVMGVTYPDVFEAVAVHSGLEYKAAESMIAAFSAMSSGGPSPSTQGYRGYQAMGSARRPVRSIVFHGSSDYTVATVNGDQATEQMLQTNDYVDDGSDDDSIDPVADQTVTGQAAGGRAYTRRVYHDASGRPLAEKWLVTGMGHAWSGGSTAGSYTDPQGPDASAEIWRFFSAGAAPPAGDTTPPTLTVSPAGATYADSVRVALSLDEPGTIAYTTDGSDPRTSGTRATLTAPGAVTLRASATLRAYGADAAGNESATQAHVYVVTVGGGDTTPPTLAISPAAGSYADSVRVTLTLDEAGTVHLTTDGSDPASSGSRQSLPGGGALTLRTTTTLRAYGVDAAGNASAQQSRVYTVTSSAPEQTATFVSLGTQDGYVRAGSAGATTGSYASSGSTVYVGDSADRGMRGVLSFDTSPLPDGATVTGAEIRVVASQSSFGTPWSTLGSLVADVRAGCFGGSCALAAGDWQAAASADAVATFGAPSSGLIGTQLSADVGAAGLAWIERAGTTQVRLRFTDDDDGDGLSDYVAFAGGDYALASYRPVLVVRYR